MRGPVTSLALYVALLATLSIAAPRRTVGDAGEYTAYALSLAVGHAPSLTRAAIADVRRDLAAIDPSLGSWDLEAAGHRAPDGRVEFVHFWAYSAIAAPFVAATRGLHADPRDGFVVVNIFLLACAFAVVARRLSVGAAWLLCASPILWWADKAQIEVFVFALTTIALAMRERPIVAAVCVGLAAIQVPPLVVLLALVAIGAGSARRAALPIAVGAAIAAVPVVYDLWRFHTPTLFVGAAQFHWPTRAELGASVWDLNLGLVPNWPIAAGIVLAAMVAAIVRPSAAAWRDLAAVATVVAALAVAFAQIGNFMSGGTPGVLRYAVWLIPLAVPLLQRVIRDVGWTRVVAGLAIVSVPMCLVRDRPSVAEFAERPSAIALAVWRHAPAWSHPLPVVFAGSLGQRTLPAVTDGCTKILLVGRGDVQEMWPRACAPFPVPAECRLAGTLCYANRASTGYTFDRVKDDGGDLKFDPSTVWIPRTGR